MNMFPRRCTFDLNLFVPLLELKHLFTPPLFQVEKAKPIKCGTFGASSLQQRHIATGDFDGNLHIWYFSCLFTLNCGFTYNCNH